MKLTKCYVGVLVFDTIEHNDLIADRCPIERVTSEAAEADARAMLQAATRPRDAITDLRPSFIAYKVAQ